MDTRFVTCPDCDGYGATVHATHTYEPGCGFSHPDSYETPCLNCNGTGLAETEVWPVECGDDETDLAARHFVEGRV